MLHFCMLRTEALTKMDNSLRFRSLRRNYETHRARILLEHRARAKSAVAAGADSLKQRRVSAEAAVPQRSGRRYKVDGTSGAMTKEAFASLASLGLAPPRQNEIDMHKELAQRLMRENEDLVHARTTRTVSSQSVALGTGVAATGVERKTLRFYRGSTPLHFAALCAPASVVQVSAHKAQVKSKAVQSSAMQCKAKLICTHICTCICIRT